MKRPGQRFAKVLSVVVLAVLCGAGLLTIIAAGPPADWPQWGRDPQHSGEVGSVMDVHIVMWPPRDQQPGRRDKAHPGTDA